MYIQNHWIFVCSKLLHPFLLAENICFKDSRDMLLIQKCLLSGIVVIYSIIVSKEMICGKSTTSQWSVFWDKSG